MQELQQVTERRNEKLVRELGPLVASCLQDHGTEDILLNPDGQLWVKRTHEDCRGRSARCGSVEHAQSVEHRTSGWCGERTCKRCARRTDSLGESSGGSDCGSPTAIDSRSCKCGRLRGWRTKHSCGSQGPRGCGSHWVPRRRLRAGVCVGSLMENRKQQSGLDSVHDTSAFSCGLFVTVAVILA